MSGTDDVTDAMNKASSRNRKLWRHEANWYLGGIILDKHPVLMMRTCLTCSHWRDGPRDDGQGNTVNYAAGCLKYNVLPPPHVLVTGCDDYDDAWEIPF